ncbi:hypothetical protein [Silvanigrella aquatica]|uniref:Uncharacterized protein n=1 Tax=Silvanigrella aquatica TaxID=1915309 RepID=A0A1L4CZ17_9BACT|nr:hypothetical protein [Silvanigrella aquatica]APJ03191.1 hypothetical protein AXG55_04450 [Silvanigrella aquatica]
MSNSNYSIVHIADTKGGFADEFSQDGFRIEGEIFPTAEESSYRAGAYELEAESINFTVVDSTLNAEVYEALKKLDGKTKLVPTVKLMSLNYNYDNKDKVSIVKNRELVLYFVKMSVKFNSGVFHLSFRTPTMLEVSAKQTPGFTQTMFVSKENSSSVAQEPIHVCLLTKLKLKAPLTTWNNKAVAGVK